MSFILRKQLYLKNDKVQNCTRLDNLGKTEIGGNSFFLVHSLI